MWAPRIPTCNNIELSSKLIMNICEFLMMESTFSQNLSWDVIKSVKSATNGGNAAHWTVEIFEIFGTSFGLNKILHESNLFYHSHSEKEINLTTLKNLKNLGIFKNFQNSNLAEDWTSADKPEVARASSNRVKSKSSKSSRLHSPEHCSTTTRSKKEK